jgi:hypothetical protein
VSKKRRVERVRFRSPWSATEWLWRDVAEERLVLELSKWDDLANSGGLNEREMRLGQPRIETKDDLRQPRRIRAPLVDPTGTVGRDNGWVSEWDTLQSDGSRSLRPASGGLPSLGKRRRG